MPALHNGIDEMRGADHHAIDLLRRAVGALQYAGRAELLQRVEDAGSHVLAGRRLDRAYDLAVLDQDGVGVGAADIDTDSSHDANTLLKSRS